MYLDAELDELGYMAFSGGRQGARCRKSRGLLIGARSGNPPTTTTGHVRRIDQYHWNLGRSSLPISSRLVSKRSY